MPTSRRDFLKTSVLASSLLFVPKFLHALDRQGLETLADANGRRLVVVQLGGGNDGLNTVVPFRNDLYYKARPHAGHQRAKWPAGVGQGPGLHPSMTGLKGLYDQGHVAVLNSVGYPNPTGRTFARWISGRAARLPIST